MTFKGFPPNGLQPASGESFELTDLGEPTYTMKLPAGGTVVPTSSGLVELGIAMREADLESAVVWFTSHREIGGKGIRVDDLLTLAERAVSLLLLLKSRANVTDALSNCWRLGVTLRAWLRREPGVCLEEGVGKAFTTMLQGVLVGLERIPTIDVDQAASASQAVVTLQVSGAPPELLASLSS